MNHLTQDQCQKADLIEATVWDAACILYFTSLFDTVRVVKLFWSLYHVVVAVSSAVWWKSAPKWQWNMNVFFFFVFCFLFLSLCSLMKNFKYTTGILLCCPLDSSPQSDPVSDITSPSVTLWLSEIIFSLFPPSTNI